MNKRIKKLFEIIPDDIRISADHRELEVVQIEIDSRKVSSQTLFIAIKGHQTDGHLYVARAIEAGATVIVHNEDANVQKIEGVIYIPVSDTSKYAGLIAHKFYDYPSYNTQLIGVTGTNGKTSVVTLLYQAMVAMGYKVGLISTVQNRIGDVIVDATHTTPDAINLNRLLAEMVENGCDYVFMEVSSHAIDQQRISGLKFRVAAFTNISHDHLDYHDTFKEYIWTKKKFFDYLDKEATAISNIDDKRGEVMLQNTSATVKTFALRSDADYTAKIITDSIEGLHMIIDRQEIYFQLSGRFNAYNLLTVYAILMESGLPSDEILPVLSQLKGAEGRFEKIVNPVTETCAIVDYAHTPDALDNVLQTIKQTISDTQKIITVVGCGGDRDKAKRPIMAQIAASLSSKVVLTSDNPRSENPEAILDDMEEGLLNNNAEHVLRIADRKQAIRTAIALANDRDIILVAGKGHEKYQEIKGEKFPFDDKEIIRNEFNRSSKED